MHNCFLSKSQMSITQMLEQDPAATEEAASFGEMISFGRKKLRQSYDAVARFQLESRVRNCDFLRCGSERRETAPERPRKESSPTALKAAVEDRRAQRPS